MRRVVIAAAVAAAAAVGSLASSAGATPGDPGVEAVPLEDATPPPSTHDAGPTPVSEEEATEALEAAEEALAGEADDEATTELRDLAIALPALGGAERRSGERILARPTDGRNDPQGDGYAPGTKVQFVCSQHFCVHWATSGRDAPPGAVPNGPAPPYVDEVLAAAERSFEVENERLGWRPPKPDGRTRSFQPPPPHTNKTDIYLKQIGNQGLFGYAAPDPNQGPKRRQFAYLVIDNDYAPREFPGYPSPLLPMRVTIAHEYNHILQFNYDVFQDNWLFESSATWMEEQVFPAIDDYIASGYVGAFARRPHVPITKSDRSLKIYGTAVWAHWLSARIRKAVVERAWALSTKTKPKDFAAGAYDKAIRQMSSTDFHKQFVRFAAATAEWRAIRAFPDSRRYPNVRRAGRLRLGQGKARRINHTAYELFNVTQRPSRKLLLRVKAAKRTRSGIALVGREGKATKGKVTIRTQLLPRGGRGEVTLPKPRRFKRITAAVVNADIRVDGFRGSDWVYRRDKRNYALKLKRR